VIVDRLFHSVRSVVKKGSFNYDRPVRENTYSVSRISIFLGGDCMKRIIAISVMFVLLTGAAFAVDLGGNVIGSATVLQGNNLENSKVESGGGLGRVRIDGAGGDEDGKYGGWVRFDPTGGVAVGGIAAGIAWWKPIDLFKLSLGGNPDGHFGKEGVTGWMFYQHAYDTAVVIGGNVWGWGPLGGGDVNMYGHDVIFRDAFFGGFGGGNGTILEFTADILAINIVLPFFEGGETADAFKKVIAQLDVKLDFGNIALTYVGGRGYNKGNYVAATGGAPKGAPTVMGPTYKDAKGDDKQDEYFMDANGIWQQAAPATPATGEEGYDEPSKIFAYFGGSFGPLAVDFGLGYGFAKNDGKDAQPIAVGLGLKYGADAFGVKFRVIGKLAGDDKVTRVLADVLPYFVLSDTMRAFVSVGLGMMMKDGEDSIMDWHFNPYLEVGQEWGAKFLAGIKVWQYQGGKDKGGAMSWAVPIAIVVSF